MARGSSPKSPGRRVYDMISWFILFCHYSIVWLCCSHALRDIRCTSMARYRLFVLKVITTKQQTKPCDFHITTVNAADS